MKHRLSPLLAIVLLAPFVHAGGTDATAIDNQQHAFDQLKNSLAGESNPASRIALLDQAYKDIYFFQDKIIEAAQATPGPETDAFLTTHATSDKNCCLRRCAVICLGNVGSEKCLSTLLTVAKSDAATEGRMPATCLAEIGTARRDAIFALAQLAFRFPNLADQITAELKNLPAPADAKDPDQLADARVQALFQITHDESLLQPFYDRLKSSDPAVRITGLTAFRFLKLKTACSEITQALKDPDPSARSWAALLLGEIADPDTAPLLITAAADTKESSAVRNNAIASLGHMKAASAADDLQKLLADPDPTIQTNAAIALYRITGKKEKQFPEGYSAD